MKRTESIQVRLPDGGRLHLRVSPEEKEMIRSKAEAEKNDYVFINFEYSW